MLEQYKKEHGLTNAELAELLGVNPMTVFRAIHYKKVGPKMMKAIAKLLDIDVVKVYEYYKQS